MATLLHDLRDALRALGKNRGFTAAALLVLALGIGANTTIYTVVRAVALRPLPFDRSERLMFIGESSPSGTREAIAPANFIDLARESRSFARMAMHRGARLTLTGRAGAESVIGANVSSSFFAVLGVEPQIGRSFLPDDEQPRGPRPAVLSHDGWTRLFSGDPAVVGRVIGLDGVDHIVVGVLDPAFSLWDADIWIAGFDRIVLNNRAARSMGAIGRLSDGVSRERAQAEVDTIARRLADAYPQTNAGWTFRTVALQEAWLGVYRPAAFVLLAAMAMVLLIACSNLANLLLERAIAREREVSIRLALGARVRRIAQQAITESVVLALLGGAAGVLVAYWSLGVVVAQIPANTLTQIPGGSASIRLDGHILGVVLLTSVVTGVGFGLAPAIRVAWTDPQGALRQAARGAGGSPAHFWRRSLVVAQVALSSILLIGATLMIRSFWHLQALDRGYDAEDALSLSMLLPLTRYPEPGQRERFFDDVIERVSALPGVTHAGGATLLSARGRPFAPEGRLPARRELAPTAVYRAVTPGYLRAIGIALVRGRQFTPADSRDAPAVAIVNQTLARAAWPGGDPVGRRLRLPDATADVSVTVVGVAADVRESLDPRYPLRLDPRPTIYRPASQEAVSGMTLIVRTESDPLSLATAVRREIAAVDSSVAVLALQSLRQGLSESMATPRFHTMLLLGFAALALVLAAVGVYGVIAYAVRQRTQELGIRLALGAAPHALARSILGDGVTLALIGAGLGVLGAFGAVRLIASYLYGVQPLDPVAFLGVPLVLAAVAAIASYLPARRAASVDPLIALRDG